MKRPLFHPSPQHRSLLALLAVSVVCVGLALLTACAQASIEKPKTFAETELVTNAIATEVLTQADVLLTTGKIKPADARNLVKQTDAAQDGVALARTFAAAGDASAANARLAAALRAVQGLRDYLLKMGGSFTPRASG